MLAYRELLTEALIQISTDPAANRARWEEIRALLGETLDKRGIAPLTSTNMLWILTREGLEGLHRRGQTVMHLIANSQQLGIVVKSDYMHLSRSLFAAAGAFASLYEDESRLLLLRDLVRSLGRFPLLLAQDKVSVRVRGLREQVAERLPLSARRPLPLPLAS